MTIGWERKRLADVIEAVGTVDPARTPEKSFKYVDVSSVSNTTFEIEEIQELLGRDAPSRARRHIQRGDVLFATIRPTLKRIAVVPEHLHGEVCSTGYFVFRTKPILDGRYLFYYLMTPQFMGEMEKLQTGASYPAVNDAQVKSQFIGFPSLAEQKRIVAILDEAFEGIAKATANAERNLANARELIAGSCHALISNVAPDAERVSLETLLERGWILSHLDGNHGSDYPRKEEFVTQGIPYISANSIDDDAVDMGAAKYLAPERAARIRKGVAQDGDVLFAHNATVGPVAILETSEPKVILGTSLTYYRCNAEKIDNRYLAHYMRSRLFTSQYDQVMRQSTRNQVPITKQREFFHVIPPLEAQREISHRLDALEESSRTLRHLYAEKTDRCIELRQSLLHKAFSGQLTGKEAIAV